MKKPRYYLLFYKEWMKSGKMDCNGLCANFGNDELFQLIDPESGLQNTYWGCDDYDRGEEYRCDTCYEFGPLRQNVVLLMAAMNGEL